MCGIAGIISKERQTSVQQEGLLGMVSMLRHRGPDEFGLYLNGPVGLGSARLSIIDLSGGQQPISNEDQTLWIVYNGEIFNYPELRRVYKLRTYFHHTYRYRGHPSSL